VEKRKGDNEGTKERRMEGRKGERHDLH